MRPSLKTCPLQIYSVTSQTVVFHNACKCEKASQATKHFSSFVSHRTLDILSPEVNTSKIHYNVVYKRPCKKLGFGKPHSMLFIFPPLHSPAHSTRLLWRSCSPGTPNTDASLETPSMQTACILVRRKGEGRTKRRREQLCSWLHLPASVISIPCECKQTKT